MAKKKTKKCRIGNSFFKHVDKMMKKLDKLHNPLEELLNEVGELYQDLERAEEFYLELSSYEENLNRVEDLLAQAYDALKAQKLGEKTGAAEQLLTKAILQLPSITWAEKLHKAHLRCPD